MAMVGDVLILIVVDNGLVRFNKNEPSQCDGVLILIVVEDGLVQYFRGIVCRSVLS